MFRNLFEKIMESIVYYPFYKWIFCNVYRPLFFNSRVIYQNEIYIVFNDGSFMYDMSYSEFCDKNNLNWIDEIERLYPKEIFDEF